MTSKTLEGVELRRGVFITSTKAVMFSSVSICVFVGWFVCQQNHTKTPEQISTKPIWRKGFGPE